MPEQTERAMRGGIFHSGDLGKKNENGDFVLIGRANDMIKINGNRIEPAEIEAAFKHITNKDWCAVRGFEKPEQSFICLYYTGGLEQDEQEIRDAMQNYLPYYMIPAHFVKIDTVPLLPNGKLNRKELPEPDLNADRAEYVAPVGEFETNLCKAFEEILHVEKVGRTENFYDLGGSSLSALEVLAYMNLDDLSAVDIYQGRTAEKITEIYQDRQDSAVNNAKLSDEEREEKARQVPHHVPPIQAFVLDFQLFNAKASMFMFRFLISFEDNSDANAERVLNAAKKLIAHQSIFGTIFEFNDLSELITRYDKSVIQDLKLENISDEECEKILNMTPKPFKMLGGPLVTLRVFKTPSGVKAYFVFHHLAMDGSSVQLVMRNFVKAYLNQPMDLDTYYSYLQLQDDNLKSKSFKDAKEYYKNNYENIDWCGNIVPDKDEPGNTNGVIPIPFNIAPKLMAELEKRHGTSRNEFILTAIILALHKIENKDNVMSSFAFHNRVEKYSKNAGGLTLLLVPVGVNLKTCKTLNDLYKAVRKKSIDGLAASTYDWLAKRTNPFVDEVLLYVYETASITGYKFFDEIGAKFKALLNTSNEAALRLTVLQIFEKPNEITGIVAYMTNKYSEQKMTRFAETVGNIINKMAQVQDSSSVSIAEILNF